MHALRRPGSPAADFAPTGVTWYGGELLTPGVPHELIDALRPTHLLDAAWNITHNVYWTSRSNLMWVSATSALIDAFVEAKGERFVSVGTCAEYDWSHGYFTEGVTPENPATLYGTCKLLVSRLLMAAADQFDFSAAHGRLYFLFDPNEGPDRLVSYACRKFAAKQPAKFSSGTQIRDFMHVQEAARGLVCLLASDIQGPCNISSGEPARLKDIVAMIESICGYAGLAEIGAIPDRPGDPPIIVGDNRKLLSTGWSPRATLQESLAETYVWWRKRTD